jgi:hypothetical protein
VPAEPSGASRLLDRLLKRSPWHYHNDRARWARRTYPCSRWWCFRTRISRPSRTSVSEELLTDSAFDLSGFLTQEFGERIGLLDAGQPLRLQGGDEDHRQTHPEGDTLSGACTCKGWRGLWRTLLWGVPHLFCDRCGREVRDD